MSMPCFPGSIGGGGIPAFFFTTVVGCCGLAGWLAMLAHVIFFCAGC
jgi:hypothetical protein